jgi:hypothetical protein
MKESFNIISERRGQEPIEKTLFQREKSRKKGLGGGRSNSKIDESSGSALILLERKGQRLQGGLGQDQPALQH